jgi:glucan 1,3-beta-glucosidase
MLSSPDDDVIIYAKNNTQQHSHPFWSILAGYLDNGVDNEVLECADDDDSDACASPPLCDYTLDFPTLDAVKAAMGSFSAGCADFYSNRALRNMLQQSVDQFSSTDNGYDPLFKYYVESVKDFVPNGLTNFMAEGGAGNQYFTCAFVSAYQPGVKTTRITHQCPITQKEIGYGGYTITYTLDDADGFFNDLQSQLGIQKDWVKFEDQYIPAPCFVVGAPCPAQGANRVHYPLAADTINVSNPKDIVTAAMTNITATQFSMLASEIDLVSGLWYGSTNDIVQVNSMPVLMLQQALDAMSKAKALGSSQKTQDTKNLIMEILSVVFMFIPFLDDIAPAALAAARIGAMVGDAGSLAVTIQDIVSDPGSAPLAILGVLGGAGATLADVGNMARLASARRGIPEETVTGIGPTFRTLDDDLKAIEKPACKI